MARAIGIDGSFRQGASYAPSRDESEHFEDLASLVSENLVSKYRNHDNPISSGLGSDKKEDEGG